MLVLTRKVEETITIGDNITIRVIRIRDNTVRIGIDAPKHVHILRGELDVDRKSRTGNTVERANDTDDGNNEGGHPSCCSERAGVNVDAGANEGPAPGCTAEDETARLARGTSTLAVLAARRLRRRRHRVS
ncbi:MAG: carbon storage regulator CsrA [Planctomycetales bacterium]|nr:carbon storage regulator CsrA [Planctomycetales bacterium]